MGIFKKKNDIVRERAASGLMETRSLVQTVEQMQKGVIRTNCIDCLDRTNVAQQMICLHALIKLVPGMEDASQWEESLIYLWAMGGDFISKEYSGTESVLTKITLKGHQNAFDKVE